MATSVFHDKKQLYWHDIGNEALIELECSYSKDENDYEVSRGI